MKIKLKIINKKEAIKALNINYFNEKNSVNLFYELFFKLANIEQETDIITKRKGGVI